MRKYAKYALPSAILLLFLVFISGCDKDKMTFYKDTKSINLADENIKSITIHSNSSDVKKAFGEPQKIKTSSSPRSKYYIFETDKEKGKLEFKISNNEVQRYLITNKETKTNRGISIGDSKRDIIKAYGKHFYERTDTGATIMGYFDKKNKLNLEFAMDNNNMVNGILFETMENE